MAEETAGFTFEVQAPFAFVAGQTCDLTIASPRYADEKGSSRTFSIASSPLDTPRILFATRLTGSAFKRTLLGAPTGLEIELEGPGGSFVLQEHRQAGGLLCGRHRHHAVSKHDQGRDRTAAVRPHRAVLLESKPAKHRLPERPRSVAARQRELSSRCDDHGFINDRTVGLMPGD